MMSNAERKRRWPEVKELQDRMKRFGLSTIRVSESLPVGRAASIVSNQMVCPSTSAGANYRASCRVRSKADFISKVGIVEEELDETLYWLEVSLAAGFISEKDAGGLIQEANELLGIVVSSIRTVKRAS